MKILIKGGRVIDPASQIDAVKDVMINEGKPEKIIDATGKIVIPGLVDMHVHLREPGREDKETVLTGTRAAIKGGVTAVLAMPNTTPAIDFPENAALLKDIIKKTACCNVYICGAITQGRLGEKLSPIAALKKSGALAISDDGNSVDNPEILLKALKAAKANNLLLICHCEDKILSAGGVVNLGIVSTRLGLKGISNAAEYTRIKRDIDLAAKVKLPIHIAHVSCKESVEIIAAAKKKGIAVTAETAPHYFALTEEAALEYDTNMKINPPLRSKEDVAAIKQGLKNGVIDCIASDHAPHTENEKDIEFDRAEFGSIGLETSLAISITELVKTGILTWGQLVEKMACNPAKILKINKGTLAKGRDADVVIVDPHKEWVLKREEIVSKSQNSAFIGRRLTGKVEYAICAGKIVYQA
ncbi:MAG: dihydroorotase [Candidatus Omnitrophota bacterium]